MVNIELSVVPEMGMENLLPSSSKKSMNVVKDRGLGLVKTASTFSFYFVTPRFSPSGKRSSIGSFPTSFAIFGLNYRFS